MRAPRNRASRSSSSVARSFPSTRTAAIGPLQSGETMSSVDLPEPEGPTRPTASPRRSSDRCRAGHAPGPRRARDGCSRLPTRPRAPQSHIVPSTYRSPAIRIIWRQRTDLAYATMEVARGRAPRPDPRAVSFGECLGPSAAHRRFWRQPLGRFHAAGKRVLPGAARRRRSAPRGAT